MAPLHAGMLDTDAAARLLWTHRETAEPLQALPPALRPADRAAGHAIQARLPAVTGRSVVGWKIAATSVAGQAHIGVSGPLAGRVLSGLVDSDGDTVSLAGNRMCVAEPEFAFRLGRELPPRPLPYSVAEVLEAVDALLPSIEVPNSRFIDFARAGEPQLIADGSLRLTREGDGSAVLGDPRVALTWLVNELSALGIALEPGQFVSTGTCMVPLEVQPGDRVEVDYGAFGRLGISFGP